ncbi:hypothetical protein DDZ13_11555 [Coraliomargarita sinensis]|uniref:DUF3568 domain-containing protein n=2 Tax=Coraliomargarita sinensis TaxID=2174842 RepID=A0A317ZIL5_9BACT|nr:hypothetical protein DDZ13_11555 [Coraliomargarita sinensis]
MNMKATLNTVLAIFILIAAGCTTPVAIDPQTGEQQTAKFQAGYFYAPLDADIGTVFRTAIRELDEMGYYRTGELHKEKYITIYARKVGDEKITVKSYYPSKNSDLAEAGKSALRIRVGKFGNLAESQMIYARIRDAL